MLPYYPCLRFKQGEYVAMAKLPSDVLPYVEPRFVVPPPKERDPELGRVPNIDEIAHMTGDRVGKHWPLRRAFLDTRFVADELGDEGLRTLFRLAQARNPNIVPVATVSDLCNPLFLDIQCKNGPVKLSVLVDYEQVDRGALATGLSVLGLSAADCVLFIDFTGATLKPEIAAGSISGVFGLFNEIGPWHRIVFQASNFPETNPPEYGKNKFVPRDEWFAFHEAMKECDVPPERIGYGDFGADTGKMVFPRSKGGGKATRHIRYTGKTHTLIVFADKDGKDAEQMKKVCQRVMGNDSYAGQQFSEADNRIFRVANGMDGPGNASMWREWNTMHHVMRVVRDLGAMDDVKFADGWVSEVVYEQDLF
ncbi:beta family protein [Asticcacaulis taihuensis]|uniref:beta family protein n=1 Tax=Asticcacaulis taihuensis TaxID=260084 RepID=UPI003F7B5272